MRKFWIILAICIGVLGAVPLKAQAAHSVDLTFTGPSCNTAKPCTAQIYRFTGNCPASGIGSGLNWVPLTTTLAGTIPATGAQTWAYSDTQVAATATYCYYATATYTAGVDGPSGPSNTFQGTIPGAPSSGTLNGKVN